MTTFTQEYLKTIEVGAPHTFRNITIHSLRSTGPAGPACITLSDALERETAVIEELDDDGSVPFVKIRNDGDVAVLILEGEELLGAKQNRVPNISILVAAGRELKIPVSCTEAGRWAHTSQRFSHSGHVAAPSIRARKMSSVSRSVRIGQGFRSDQREVWDGIDEMSATLKSPSSTRAMSESYRVHARSIADCRKALTAESGQTGMIAFVDGKPAGCDVVSSAEVYSRLHDQLVASYALAVVAGRKGRTPRPDGDGDVADFLAAVAQCGDERFDSVGMGQDFRFEGPDVVGSALVVVDAVVHAVFFPRSADEDEPEKDGERRTRIRRFMTRMRRRD